MKRFDGRLLASIIFIIIVGYGAFRVRHDLEKMIWQLKKAQCCNEWLYYCKLWDMRLSDVYF